MSALFRWLDPVLNPIACLPPPPEPPETPQADALLKRLEAWLRKPSATAFSGDKRAWVRGQGLDFADLREYTPGDDIRKMDWNVFARTLTPHVREYHEEKQLTVWLAVDLTPSMRFGRTRTKLRHAIELAGLCGLLAQRANHKLGGFLLHAHRPEILPPQTGYAALQRLLQRLLISEEAEPSARVAENPLPAGLEQLGRLVEKNATVLFLSDFLCGDIPWESALGQLSHRAQLVSLCLRDPAEETLPCLGLQSWLDPETGAWVQADTRDATLRARYAAQVAAHQQAVAAILEKAGVYAPASTADDPLTVLRQLLFTGRVRR